MRKDIDRIYIFPINPFTYQEKNKRIYIKPAEAIILALFDGKKSIDDVTRDIQIILKISANIASRIVGNVVKRYGEYLVDADLIDLCHLTVYDPLDFIIPKDKIDTDTVFPKIPEIIMFIPTFSCSFHCKYCYAPGQNNRKLLRLSDIAKFLKQTAEWQIPSIFFSGGDPYNHPQIADIMKLCIANKIKPILPTKSILTNKHIDYLCELGISEIQISIDTNNQQECQKLIGAAGSYVVDLYQQIKTLISRGFNVYTNTVLTSSTIRNIPLLIRQLYLAGVKRMSFSQYSRSQFCHCDELFCTPNDYQWLENETNKLSEQLPQIRISYKNMRDPIFMNQTEKELYFTTRPNCTAGKMGMVILPDGKVTICETLYYQKDLLLGDLIEASLGEIWHSEQRRRIVKQAHQCLARDVCTSCPEAEYCYLIKGKCYVRSLQAFNDVKMPDPYCPRSPGGLRIL